MPLTPARIRMHLSEAGITQAQLALQLAVSQTAISLTIAGKRRTGPASTAIRRAICEAIRKPYRVVWGGDAPPAEQVSVHANSVKNFTPAVNGDADISVISAPPVSP